MAGLMVLDSVEIDTDHVWERLGYDGPEEASSRVQHVFEKAVQYGKTLLDPRACYEVFSIEHITPSSVNVQGGACLKSKKLAARCRDAEELAVFIVTIGSHLEEQVEQLFASEDPMMGFILNSFGSEATTMLFYQLRDIVNNYAQEQGLQMNDWFCPGWRSLGWDICELKTLLSLVNARRVGVQLRDSCMMSPRNSYAGVLPLVSGYMESKDEG